MKAKAVGACVLSLCASLAFGADQAPSLRQRALEHCGQVVFAVRSMGGDGHWYANFGHHVSNADSMQYGPGGGQLCRLDLRTGKLDVLLDDPKGGVRDPVVSYDGTKVLFSYRKGGSRYYHLYEINAGGGGLRQITDGPFDEIEPIYLPDGDLLFCSSRCNRFVQCWFTQVAVMYRSGPNGENMRLISANVEQDNTPWMMPDGRVLYMRWEYVDRSRVQYHHLWTANPDGTGVMTYFGNMHPGNVLLDAKPIAGTNKVVTVFSPGHGQKEHAGRIGIIDPDAGPDERKWVNYVGKGSDYRDPYPLAEDLFLVADDTRIILLDAAGQTETLYTATGANMKAHEPRPLTARPREHVIPSRAHGDQATGRLILADVTHGRNMGGVKAGEIKKLLVMESLPKPVNFSGSMEPLTLGGSFTLPRILGTVPVEPDGSAFMDLPAARPLFFVALDGNDMSVKRMQSFVSVMPGETTSCSGCHEDRTDTARFRRDAPAGLLATRRPPSRVEPIPDVPDVMDFPRDIQPILDRWCIKCHNYDQPPPKGVPLIGARGPTYSHSYFALMDKNYVSHGRDAVGNIAPRRIGSSASRLMKQIDGTHNRVALTELEHRKIRLWIESGAPYPGTYAALGTGMVSPSVDMDVVGRRCGQCHRAKDIKKPLTAFKTPDELLVNLTDPARSPILLAALAKDAGGWGLCKGELRGSVNPAPRDPAALAEPAAPAAATTVSAIFQSTDDPDYRKLLAGIDRAKRQLDQATRFDKPGFRPNRHYVREMKRYGILPADADPDKQPIDVYATDQAYWRSFWHQPAAK